VVKRPAPSPPDTIAAIATAPGRGGIGVVRISGSALLSFAEKLTGKIPEPRLAGFVRFLDRQGETLDEGLLLYFPAPSSFTGEDVIELQGHGSPVALRLLLNRCVELGARLANPGEFSQRAFINGKMDLAQAEAVADLIESSTEAAARSAVRSLGGAFSREINALRDELIDLRMLVEATLDFPEEEVDFLEQTRAVNRLERVRDHLRMIFERAAQGALLRTGMNVVLVGQPNVGKSSLLNALAGNDRAIVTEVAGTTRDILKETIQIEGIPLHIIDTAGLRETDDKVERIGVERAWHEIAQADVVLRLIDARQGSGPADEAIDARIPAHIARLTIFNKIDLFEQPPARVEAEGRVSIYLSAKQGSGVALLHDELLQIAGWQAHGEDVLLARERHLSALRAANEHIDLATQCMNALELFAEELRIAQMRLCEITGEFSADDLLGVIFSRFCIGK